MHTGGNKSAQKGRKRGMHRAKGSQNDGTEGQKGGKKKDKGPLDDQAVTGETCKEYRGSAAPDLYIDLYVGTIAGVKVRSKTKLSRAL